MCSPCQPLSTLARSQYVGRYFYRKMDKSELLTNFVSENISVLNVLSLCYDEATVCSLIGSLVTPDIQHQCLQSHGEMLVKVLT